MKVRAMFAVFVVRKEDIMRGLIICLFLGVLSLVACGAPASSQQQSDLPQATPTATTESEVALPAATSTSLLPTPSPEAIEPTPTSTLVLPPPTDSEIEAVSPVATPTPSQAEPVRSTSDKSTELSEGAVITYQMSGGFAGKTQQWAIYADGRITRSDGREWQITPAEVEQLLADIKAAGFFELGDSYMPLNTCCDRITYTLTVKSDDQVKTVTTMDAAPNVPEELSKVQERLGNLLFALK